MNLECLLGENVIQYSCNDYIVAKSKWHFEYSCHKKQRHT